MGEAPFMLEEVFSNGIEPVSVGCESVLAAGDKKYIVGNDEWGPLLEYWFSTKVNGAICRISPVVLGDKPKAGTKLYVFVLNDEHMVVIKRDAAPEDSIWFLEFNTKFVRAQSQAHGTEVVAWSKGVLGDDSKPVVISGPSGVGKGTLISKLMDDFPKTFGFSVSHTTRAPRQKELNGIHYHFTERSAMEREIKDGKFLEFALVHDNLYGSSVEAVEVVADAGKRCILDIDVQGASQVKESPLGATFIFIRPPSFSELENRLRARGTETEEQVQKRLRNAKAEIEQGLSSGIFDHVVENDDLNECYQNLKKLLGLDVTPGIFKTLPVTGPSLGIKSQAASIVVVDYNTNQFILDFSRLRGGAPGKTRGVKLHPLSISSQQTNYQFIN